MTVTYGFYNSVGGDRKYDATAFGSVFDGIITDGVFLNYGNHLLVSQDTGLNMNVIVASGRAWFNHTWTFNDNNLVLAIDPSEAVLNRIDAVILEVDSSDGVRANSIKVLKGTPASNPVNPTLTNTTTKHQYALAYVRVNAGVTGISYLNITNNIGTVATPFTTALLDTVTIEELYSNWQTQYNQMMADDTAQFDSWFTNLVNQLSGSQVTNLQAQIDAIKANGTDWRLDTSTFSFVSNDAVVSTGVISTPSDKTGVYRRGMRVKYDQVQALTGYWDFNTNSAAQVGSFTPTDTAMTYTAGKFGNAATFNGTTSKIVLTDTALLKPTGEFTLGLWFKTSSAGAYKFLFQSQSHNTLWSGLYLALNTANVLELAIGNNTLSTAAGLTVIAGTTTVTDGNWHQVVVSYKNNYVQIYLDGSLEVAGYTLAPAYAATNYVRIGCQNATGTDSNFMNGQIDDLYLINGYALDGEYIKSKYRAATAQGSGSITVTKKGIITYVSDYSGGITSLTIYGGTDHTLANSTITNFHASSAKVPFGFDPNPDKWSVLYQDNLDQTLNSPTSLVWTNLGSAQLTVPIGSWRLSYSLVLGFLITTAAVGTYGARSTLSTLSNTELDTVLSRGASTTLPIGSNSIANSLSSEKLVTLKNKTTYYLLSVARQTGFTSIINYGTITPTIIKAVSSYI